MNKPNKVHMVRIDLITGETKKWRDFLSKFELGDNVTFTAKDFSEVETIRSSAYQFNHRERTKPFRIKVSAKPSENPIPVTIIAESKTKTEE